MQNLNQFVQAVFGVSQNSQALETKLFSRRLIISFLGAFFIVLTASFILSFASRVLSASQSAQSAAVLGEPVAFQPGQYVTNLISGNENQGYLSQSRQWRANPQ